MTEHEIPPAEYLQQLLDESGANLGPKPERVSEAFADERIRETIGRFHTKRSQAGLWAVNEALRERDVAPGLRLHLVSAVAHLGLIADDTRAERERRAQRH